MSDTIKTRFSENGKGDKRRPEDSKKIQDNWERIFGPKKEEKPSGTPDDLFRRIYINNPGWPAGKDNG